MTEPTAAPQPPSPRPSSGRPPSRKRWLPRALGGLVLLLAVLSVLAVTHRDNLFGALNDPGKPFQVWEPPPAPDYAAPEAWVLAAPLAEDDRAAVFFIHPTTYSGGGNWNAPIDKALSNRALERVMLPNHAEPFAAAGPIFAPRYRQASLYSFLTNREDARRARAFAYQDVARAFDAFLERIGPDRAFLIAGIDQGGLHAAGLLRDRVAPDPDLRSRLIAAYVIEYPLPLDLFERDLAPLRPCRAEASTGCVAGFVSSTADDTRRVRHLTEHLMIWGEPDMTPLSGRRLLCVNPLLWNASEDFAPLRLNRGAAAAEGLEPGLRPAPAPGQTSAQCQDGVLLIEQARERRFRRPIALAERYRATPYNLFYEDIRAGVAVRAQAMLARLNERERYADPIEEEIALDAPAVNRVPD